MKQFFSLSLAVALISSIVCAENLTQTNTDKAKAIIASAVEAHGGKALLEDLHTLTIENKDVNYAVDQSRGAEPPWDKNRSSGVNAIDLDRSIYVGSFENNGGGFEARGGTIINGEESYQLDYRGGTVAKIAAPDYDTTSGPFVRVTPALLVRTLNARSANAYYLGEAVVGAQRFDVVGFSMAVGPAISMYFHKDTHLLNRSERVFPGFGLVEYEFTDYKVADGIPFNQTFRLLLNGDPSIERKNVAMQINKPLDEKLQVDAALVAIDAVQPDPLSRQEVADGVWLIGGSGTYAMYVDMGDYIFAAGGTAGGADRIKSLREVVGDKAIQYGMLTHQHSDHLLGVSDYESEGATLIAAAAHERVVRNAASYGENLRLTLVTDRMTLETPDRRVEIIDIGPTAHTEHLLVAYLPEEKILFEADHFGLPANGRIPPAVSSTKTFAKAIAGKKLAVSHFLSAHSARVGTPAELAEALQAKEYQAKR